MDDVKVHSPMIDKLNKLAEEFRRIGELHITEDTWFEGVKRAAIVKTFEFCTLVHDNYAVFARI